MLGDLLPVGQVRTAAEIQAALQPGETFLEFTVTEDVALLYVLTREHAEALELPKVTAERRRTLVSVLAGASRTATTTQRGRDPDAVAAAAEVVALSRELFGSLVPPAAWARIRGSRRVFVAAHGGLHRLPFELLVTDLQDGKPVYWIDSGPPISYVPSGGVLHWLRRRTGDATSAATTLDLLAIGDPSALSPEPAVPERGVFVTGVAPGGLGAGIGLRAHDVLVRYDGKEVDDHAALAAMQDLTEAAIAAGNRADVPVPLEVWREGVTLQFAVPRGDLGLEVARGNPRLARDGTLGVQVQMERIRREGDLERIRRLPRLHGAATEAKAIAAAWTAKDKKVSVLLRDQATEPAVFDLAGKTRYLHFACHGIAEEYAGQSLSMLVLSQPERIAPADDGLLKLDDLVNRWRGRLDGCHLVVLSACRTNVGPIQGDDAPQALPIGFFFAGVPSVVSTLWAVDDASTRELMTDFYGRLLAGETDKLAAFTAAKQALRAKYPDPFHWAPFLYMGRPE
jgi:hypothetical protein